MRKKTDNEYRKTRAFRFFRWLNGEKDPYLDQVEMKPQETFHEDNETIAERAADRAQMREKIYDARSNKELKFFNKLYGIMAVLLCVTICMVLIFAVSYLPQTGEENKPTNNEVSDRYLEQGLQDTGAVNAVAGMITSYRGFDTFGETNVLFIATCCVMILLAVEDEKMIKMASTIDRHYEPRNDVILQKVATVLVPIIFLFGIYVMLNGHLGPGGGFSGGAIMGAGLILYVCAFGFKTTQKFFNEKTYTVIKVAALCIYGCLMFYWFFTGANGLESIFSTGTPGAIISAGMIMPINVLVGFEVACTMYAFYALFRKGGL